jgi:hypothetical protein
VDPVRAILEHLARIDTNLAEMNAKVDLTNERLRHVEDAVGPVEFLTKVTDMAHSRGARTDRANLFAAAREAAHTAACEVLAALRPSRDGRADPPDQGGEPPAANSASLGQTRRRRAQVAGGSAVVALLAATLTYASWDPERAGDIRDSIMPLPSAPQPAPPIPVPAEPTPARSPTRGAGDTQIPSGPVPGLVDRRPELLPSPTRAGRASQDPPSLLLDPTGSPADTPDDCSGVGVQVRRIEVCRQRR